MSAFGGKADTAIALGLHLEAARQGVWISYEGIGRTDFPRTLGGPDELYVEQMLRAIKAGLVDRLLLSIDCLGYNPAISGLWAQQPPYNYINEVFLPKLAAAGVGNDIIHRITHDNPFGAYATTRFVTG
jgi:phosphotriesterase-related protein